MPQVIIKGTNPWTEHYSAVMAEVPDEDDPATLLNGALIERLTAADRIFICGEAGSHCVKATTEHIAQHLPGGAAKLVLLADCMSPVAGFEAAFTGFLDDMRKQGARIAKAADVIPELRYNAHI
jgi:nicotinamidase-related amidase